MLGLEPVRFAAGPPGRQDDACRGWGAV